MIVRVQKYVKEVIEAGKFEDKETRKVGRALIDTFDFGAESGFGRVGEDV